MNLVVALVLMEAIVPGSVSGLLGRLRGAPTAPPGYFVPPPAQPPFLIPVPPAAGQVPGGGGPQAGDIAKIASSIFLGPLGMLFGR